MNKKLKAKIFEKFGTQGDFVQAVNVDETFVSKIIRDRRKLDPDRRFFWARKLGCKPKDIFTDEGQNRN